MRRFLSSVVRGEAETEASSKSRSLLDILSLMQPQLSKPYDTALFAFAVLRYLGSGEVGTFNERIRSQKVQYLAQIFRASPPYRFNLYIRGPYSPDLAHDLYEINDYGIKAALGKVIPDDLGDRLGKLKTHINDKSTRELELIATLDWLVSNGGFPLPQALPKLAELKNASSEECKSAVRQRREFLSAL